MAIAFPIFTDALGKGFPPAIKATDVPQHDIEDSGNLGEFLEKLLGRLSALLFHIDRMINNVLIQGRLLPKKVNQWAIEARAIKRQVSDLLKEQHHSVKCEELVEIGISMIAHLKKCPFKDEMMYDKPIPVIIQNPERSPEKWSKRLEEKYEVEEKPHSYLEGKKMEHKRLESEQIFDTLSGYDVRKNQYDRTSAATRLPAVQVQEENVSVTPAKRLGSEPISTSESKPGTEISKISMTDTSSSSISEYEIDELSVDEIAEEGILLDDSKPTMIRNLPISVSVDSQQRAESECDRDFQAVDKMTTVTNVEDYWAEQQETEHTESNAGRIKHHEESITCPIYFQEEKLYSVVMENDHLQLKLDDQIILIGDYPSLSPSPSTHQTSPVNAMLSLVEQDLHEIPEKPNYPNSLILFLQRNKRLTLIHPSFFDTMPNLHFLDMSHTKIRILPSSLFSLHKLQVLLLRNCICLEKIPPDIANLNHMEVLDLSGTELYDLPDEISQLALLRSVKLSFYGPDDESEYEHLPSQLISPSFLSQLKRIQTLGVTVHPEDHRWAKTVACIVKDIGKLEMLNYLQFYFPEVEMFENFIETSLSWENQRLSKFNLIIGENVKRIASRVPDEVESLFSQQDRCLRYVNGEKTSPFVKAALIRVTAFYLDHHTEVQSLSDFDVSNFKALKFCVVRECPKIKAILDEKNASSAFPCLEYLGIYFLWELKHIWKLHSQAGRLKRIFKTHMPSRNFEALRYLTINTCPKLQFIFWESMLQCLNNLEELVVEDCECVEKIIKEEKKKVKYENNVLPRLRKLVLHYLPQLVSLGYGVRLSEENISVYGCPKLIHNSQPLM